MPFLHINDTSSKIRKRFVGCLFMLRLVERTATQSLFIEGGINSIQIVYSPSGNLYILKPILEA